MANPTKFSRTAVNPAVESRAFVSVESRATMQAFIDEKVAQGFRVQVTSRFNGRDMKTRQPVKVPVVHVFAPKA
jgi:hypothetical protein